MRLIPALFIVLQILLGNLCLIDMANAAGVPEAMVHEMMEVQEMAMSPANSMSPLYCEGCVTISQPRHHSPLASNTIPCANGHCFTEHKTPVAIIRSQDAGNAAMAATLPAFIAAEPRETEMLLQRGNGPSAQTSPMKTIVLRL